MTATAATRKTAPSTSTTRVPLKCFSESPSFPLVRLSTDVPMYTRMHGQGVEPGGDGMGCRGGRGGRRGSDLRFALYVITRYVLGWGPGWIVQQSYCSTNGVGPCASHLSAAPTQRSANQSRSPRIRSSWPTLESGVRTLDTPPSTRRLPAVLTARGRVPTRVVGGAGQA